MTVDMLDNVVRRQMIEYLIQCIPLSQPAQYRDSARATLQLQSTDVLRGMCDSVREEEQRKLKANLAAKKERAQTA